MQQDIILAKLNTYQLETAEAKEHALKEILQELALYALASTDFFNHALFQGGTSLRILYQLPRFSEDLDFILRQPSKEFAWEKYVSQIKDTLTLYGLHPEISDRSNVDKAVQKLFLKDDSIGKVLQLDYPQHPNKKILIKFEVDTNPPAGSDSELQYLNFPIDYAIYTQDLASNFAGKCHALLCRPYIKGRDWFDFNWYINRKTLINLEFLNNALRQYGPWQNQDLRIGIDWLMHELSSKIKKIDWHAAANDVRRFLDPEQEKGLSVWSENFFLHKVKQLQDYLK